MKTMKINLFISIFICIQILPVFAQLKQNIQEPEAEPYLNSLARLFDPQKAFQVEFKYEIESKIEKYKVNDYGSIIVKGQKYKLRIEDGATYFNGEKLWVYNKEAREVYISTPDKSNPEQMLADPFRLLASYKDFYKYSIKGEQTLNGRQLIIIELYPKNLNTSYSILRLNLGKENHELYSLEVQEKKGIIYKIFVTELIVPVRVDDSAFTWESNEYPDVLEVEM
jgi:outer membrane lipoprotein-sorting protein